MIAIIVQSFKTYMKFNPVIHLNSIMQPCNEGRVNPIINFDLSREVEPKICCPCALYDSSMHRNGTKEPTVLVCLQRSWNYLT